MINGERRTVIPVENLELAAKYRIENYRNQIFQWRDELDEKEWSKLVFLVPGIPMARENNLAVQFCAKFLGEKGEGRRIVYAESMFDETAALLKLVCRVLLAAVFLEFYWQSSG